MVLLSRGSDTDLYRNLERRGKPGAVPTATPRYASGRRIQRRSQTQLQTQQKHRKYMNRISTTWAIDQYHFRLEIPQTDKVVVDPDHSDACMQTATSPHDHHRAAVVS